MFEYAQIIGALENVVTAIEKLDRRLEIIEQHVSNIDASSQGTVWDVGRHGELHNVNVTLNNIDHALRGCPVFRVRETDELHLVVDPRTGGMANPGSS
jgi:hypothetical protein